MTSDIKFKPDHQDFKESSNLAITQTRGAFWSKKSWAEFENQIAMAPFFTLQVWVLVLQPGKIFTESRGILELSSNDTDIYARYNERVVSVVWEILGQIWYWL